MTPKTFSHRVRENTPGKYYVNQTCIYCELCLDTAPSIFSFEKVKGEAFVSQQPRTAEEIEQTQEALEGCPIDSIHSDGDLQNWDSKINKLPSGLFEHTCSCHQSNLEKNSVNFINSVKKICKYLCNLWIKKSKMQK